MVADEKCERCGGSGMVYYRAVTIDGERVTALGMCPDCEGYGTDYRERERCAEWRAAVGD